MCFGEKEVQKDRWKGIKMTSGVYVREGGTEGVYSCTYQSACDPPNKLSITFKPPLDDPVSPGPTVLLS